MQRDWSNFVCLSKKGPPLSAEMADHLFGHACQLFNKSDRAKRMSIGSGEFEGEISTDRSEAKLGVVSGVPFTARIHHERLGSFTVEFIIGHEAIKESRSRRGQWRGLEGEELHLIMQALFPGSNAQKQGESPNGDDDEGGAS